MAPALLLLLSQAPSSHSGGLDAVHRAQSLEARDPQRALSVLATIPADDAVADQATYEIAHITDVVLRDPARAETLYRDQAARFPSSPYAKLSLARADYLRLNMGDAPTALAEFEAVTEAWGRGPPGARDALLARMRHVALDFPTSPLHARALFWLSNAEFGQGHHADAIRWLDVLLASTPAPAPKDAHRAELQEAKLEALLGHYARALALDRKYLDSDDALARELARSQLDQALAARLYAWLYASGLAFLGALVLGLSIGILRRRAPLLPVPWEIWLFVPLAVMLCAVAVFKDRRVAAAMAALCAGGGVIAFLSAAYLRRVQPRGIARVGYVLAMVNAACCLSFCAVHGAKLTALVVTTITQGADR